MVLITFQVFTILVVIMNILYAILALIVLIMIVGTVPTVVLVLYPLRFFQTFSTYASINWCFIHVFVDSFQGCYKDGTDPGTFDCRWFSVLMLLTRSLLYAFTLSAMCFIYALILIITILSTFSHTRRLLSIILLLTQLSLSF